MGIPLIFNNKKGNNKKIIGNNKLINGDMMLLTDNNCKKRCEWFKCFKKSHSMKEYVSKKLFRFVSFQISTMVSCIVLEEWREGGSKTFMDFTTFWVSFKYSTSVVKYLFHSWVKSCAKMFPLGSSDHTLFFFVVKWGRVWCLVLWTILNLLTRWETMCARFFANK